MPKRPPRPTTLPWITPVLTVRDVRAAIDFCVRAFGFEEVMTLPSQSGALLFGRLRYQGLHVTLQPEGSAGMETKAPVSSGSPPAVWLHVYSSDVDALFARAVDCGAAVLQPPANRFWGDRVCRLGDPDGHVWEFATNVADIDPARRDQETP